jgi:hypothetical protein
MYAVLALAMIMMTGAMVMAMAVTIVQARRQYRLAQCRLVAPLPRQRRRR